MNKLIFLGLIPVLLLIVPNGYASDDKFFGEKYVLIPNERPAINEDFDPDSSCQFDVFQLKCIPGAEQECPEGFGTNDAVTCFPMKGCPEGYSLLDDDETGQCYPDDEGTES